MDKSSEKQNVANSSRRAWRDVPSGGGLSKPAERCLGDSLALELPPFSHLAGPRDSEWHNGVSPA